jgi:hypothetical protein
VADKGEIELSFLRDAVEEQRRYYIQWLLMEGIHNKEDKEAELLTLTELKTAYQKHKLEIKKQRRETCE